MQSETAADRYRFVIFGVLWVSYLVVFLLRLSVGPLAPFFKDDLGISNTQVGFIMSVASFGYMASMFPSGWVVDNIGAKWPIVAGEIIAGLSMIVLSVVPSYNLLLILMFIAGFGCGLLLPSTTQGIIVWFPRKERATVMGFKQTAVNIGGILTAFTLPPIAVVMGWRFGFLILGILSIIISIIAFILYREPRPGSSGPKSSETATAKALPLLEILKIREIWLVSFCGFCVIWIEMSFIAHLVLYLTEVQSIGIVSAGILLGMTEAAGGVARPGSGFASDRIFGGNRKPVIMILMGSTSVFAFIVAFFGSNLSWMVYPVFIMMGFGAIGCGAIIITLISEFGGKEGAGKAVGICGLVGFAGAAIGPTIFGYTVDTTGAYIWAWSSIGSLAALCILLLLFVREDKRRI